MENGTGNAVAHQSRRRKLANWGVYSMNEDEYHHGPIQVNQQTVPSDNKTRKRTYTIGDSGLVCHYGGL